MTANVTLYVESGSATSDKTRAAIDSAGIVQEMVPVSANDCPLQAAITRSVPFSHHSESRRVNRHATAAADRISIVESRPKPISAADDAAAPAAIATTASTSYR